MLLTQTFVLTTSILVLSNARNYPKVRERLYQQLEKTLVKNTMKYPCKVHKTVRKSKPLIQIFHICIDDIASQCTFALEARYCRLRREITMVNIHFNKTGCYKMKIGKSTTKDIPMKYFKHTLYWLAITNRSNISSGFNCTLRPHIRVTAANYVYLLKCGSNPCISTPLTYFFLENTTCVDGTWGIHCEKYCKCQNGAPCDRLAGGCSGNCSLRYEPKPMCPFTCPPNKWQLKGGNGYTACERECHCNDPEQCDIRTGICQDGRCVRGYLVEKKGTPCKKCMFGENCKFKCHCFQNGLCNTSTGKCPNDQCHARYYGKACQKSCSKDLYLVNGDCVGMCFCKDNKVCGVVNGTCYSTCTPGYSGKSCTACPRGTFGEQCSGKCHCKNRVACDTKTGLCPGGCDDKYFGDACQKTCPTGRYLNLDNGECSNNCNCFNDGWCHVTTGKCFNDTCKENWRRRGVKCEEQCFFGEDGPCSHPCRCWQNAPCDIYTGTCSNGLCDEGWSGASCQIPADFFSEVMSIGAVIGVALLLVLGTALLYCKKRQKRKKQEELRSLESIISKCRSVNKDLQNSPKRLYEYQKELHGIDKDSLDIDNESYTRTTYTTDGDVYAQYDTCDVHKVKEDNKNNEEGVLRKLRKDLQDHGQNLHRYDKHPKTEKRRRTSRDNTDRNEKYKAANMGSLKNIIEHDNEGKYDKNEVDYKKYGKHKKEFHLDDHNKYDAYDKDCHRQVRGNAMMPSHSDVGYSSEEGESVVCLDIGAQTLRSKKTRHRPTLNKGFKGDVEQMHPCRDKSTSTLGRKKLLSSLERKKKKRVGGAGEVKTSDHRLLSRSKHEPSPSIISPLHTERDAPFESLGTQTIPEEGLENHDLGHVDTARKKKRHKTRHLGVG